MTFALALVWATALVRLWRSITRGPYLWSWALTVVLWSVAVGMTAFVYRDFFEELVGPGGYHLAYHLASIVSSGGCLVYMKTLQERPPRLRDLVVPVTLPVLVAVQQVLAWGLMAEEVREAAIPPLVAEAVAYVIPYWLFVVWVGILVAIQASRLMDGPEGRDPSRSVGMALVAAACLTVAGAMTMRALHLALRAWVDIDVSQLLRVSDIFFPLSGLTFALGVLVWLLGPAMLEIARSIQVSWHLRPLWRQLARTEQLAPRAEDAPVWRVRYRCEQMVIEVLDGLRALRVRPGGGCPYRRVAEAVLEGGHVDGVAATELLPIEDADVDDREVLVKVADELVGLRG